MSAPAAGARLARPAMRSRRRGGAAAAAAAAAGAAAGPGERDPAAVRIPLTLEPSPRAEGWRQTLAPRRPVLLSAGDVVRLSETAAGPAGRAATWDAARRRRRRARPWRPGADRRLLRAGPRRAAADHRPGRPHAVRGLRAALLANGRPKIALVIGGLGLNARATRAAIETLPAGDHPVLRALCRGAAGLDRHGPRPRPRGAAGNADGADGLSGQRSRPLHPDGRRAAPETVKKLEWILSRATGYFGLTNYLGSRFLASDDGLRRLRRARCAGGAWASSTTARRAGRGGGVPRASAERVIDDQLTQAAIDQQLLALEAGALQRGQALGAGFAYPVTLEKVARGRSGLEQTGLSSSPRPRRLAAAERG